MLMLVIVLVILFIISMPVAFVFAIGCFIYSLSKGEPLLMIAQRMVFGLDSFPLLAIPLFILTGVLMNEGGTTEKILKFALRLVGHLKGGLAQANIVASLIFAGMSGSALADIGGLGRIELQMMKEDGYDMDFSAAITAASSMLGPIIPPSVAAVLYGCAGGVSIGKLLIGGFIPGIVIGIFLVITTHVIGIKRKFHQHKRSSFHELLKSFIEAIPSLMTPAILIGGIFVGIFTPTEAASVASIYAFILGVVVYRKIGLKNLPKIILEAALGSTVIMFIVSTSMPLSWILTLKRLPYIFAEILTGVTNDPLITLFIVIVGLLFLGCVMELTPLLLIFPPIILPIIIPMGVDPVHFGILMVLTVAIGLLTPPFGTGMFLILDMAKIPMENYGRQLLPYLGVLILSLFLLTCFPGLVLFLPRLMVG